MIAFLKLFPYCLNVIRTHFILYLLQEVFSDFSPFSSIILCNCLLISLFQLKLLASFFIGYLPTQTFRTEVMSFTDLFPLWLWFKQHLLPHLIKQENGMGILVHWGHQPPGLNSLALNNLEYSIFWCSWKIKCWKSPLNLVCEAYSLITSGC